MPSPSASLKALFHIAWVGEEPLAAEEVSNPKTRANVGVVTAPTRATAAVNLLVVHRKRCIFMGFIKLRFRDSPGSMLAGHPRHDGTRGNEDVEKHTPENRNLRGKIAV